MKLDRNIFDLLFYAIGVVLLFITLISARYLELVIGILLLLIVYFFIKNYKKLIHNYVITSISRHYRFNSERDVITYERDGEFVSVAVLECFLKDSGVSAEALEKIINSIDFELKIVLRIQKLNLTQYIDWIKEERSKLEHKKSVLEDENKALNSFDIANLERKISHYNSLLNRLSSGEKPYYFRYLIIVESASNDYVESINNLESKIQIVSKLMDSIFSGNSNRLKGYDLYDSIL
ncbi:MAG: hypothetical protein N3E37_03390 [Candidatus Micrarchaeota archaeon]|nr:hypothetical protein [Candidatus Micrarchaeota archaeon]